MTTTLLAVDDSKTMRKVLEITFAGEDYQTTLAEGAEEALGKLRSENPAVALVDAGLEGTSGYDLCQQMKRDAPNTSVVLLTSKHQPYDRSRGSSVGADDFIDKPFDTQQLIDKVRALAQKSGQAKPAPAATASTGPAAAGARPRPQTLAYGTPPAGGASAGPKPQAPANRPSPQGSPARPAPPAAGRPAAPAPPAATPLASRSAAPKAASREPAVAATAGDGDFAERLQGLGLSQEQVEAVLALSREVVEQVVWEVVPQLAETMIQEEIRRLTSE